MSKSRYLASRELRSYEGPKVDFDVLFGLAIPQEELPIKQQCEKPVPSSLQKPSTCNTKQVEKLIIPLCKSQKRRDEDKRKTVTSGVKSKAQTLNLSSKMPVKTGAFIKEGNKRALVGQYSEEEPEMIKKKCIESKNNRRPQSKKLVLKMRTEEADTRENTDVENPY